MLLVGQDHVDKVLTLVRGDNHCHCARYDVVRVLSDDALYLRVPFECGWASGSQHYVVWWKRVDCTLVSLCCSLDALRYRLHGFRGRS